MNKNRIMKEYKIIIKEQTRIIQFPLSITDISGIPEFNSKSKSYISAMLIVLFLSGLCIIKLKRSQKGVHFCDVRLIPATDKLLAQNIPDGIDIFRKKFGSKNFSFRKFYELLIEEERIKAVIWEKEKERMYRLWDSMEKKYQDLK